MQWSYIIYTLALFMTHAFFPQVFNILFMVDLYFVDTFEGKKLLVFDYLCVGSYLAHGPEIYPKAHKNPRAFSCISGPIYLESSI